jgi:hypothetical protein
MPKLVWLRKIRRQRPDRLVPLSQTVVHAQQGPGHFAAIFDETRYLTYFRPLRRGFIALRMAPEILRRQQGYIREIYRNDLQGVYAYVDRQK